VFVLEQTEFVIEPMSFADVPEGAELSVCFAFSTTPRKNDCLGELEYDSPILLEQDLGIPL
jgi:hypothetical protein